MEMNKIYQELEKTNKEIVELKNKPSEEHTILMMTQSSLTGKIQGYEEAIKEADNIVRGQIRIGGTKKEAGFVNEILGKIRRKLTALTGAKK